MYPERQVSDICLTLQKRRVETNLDELLTERLIAACSY